MAVDLALAKQHLRVDDDEQDFLISAYLNAAMAWVENHTGKLLTRREVAQPETRFGAYITLNHGPDPADVEIVYSDGGGDQAIADTRVVQDRLYPASGWPSISTPAMIIVSYVAGYAETPADLDAAVLLLTGDFFANREAGTATPAVTAAVQALCSPYRSVLV